MTTSTPPAPPAQLRAEALAERLFGAMIGVMDLAAIHVGERLGLYEALALAGPASARDLAWRTGTDERYVREWLEQQAVTGILTVTDDTGDERRVFALPEGHDAVLLDADGPAYMAPAARLSIGALGPLERLLEAFRTGEGVPYADYGDDTHEGIAAINRPLFLAEMAEWTAALPDIDRRLREHPRPRIADIGCGHGWSSIALARAYPTATVDGLDSDRASIARAAANAERTGVADRVGFVVQDAADPSIAGAYALVTVFEALHDMPRPVEALRVARSLLEPGGAVLVADSLTDDRFTAPGDDLARFQYGCSVLHCLPVGRCGHDSAATGTVMRPGTLAASAGAAGFTRVEILPVEHPFWRFTRLGG